MGGAENFAQKEIKMVLTDQKRCEILSSNIEHMLKRLERANKRGLERENVERLNDIFQELAEVFRNLNIKRPE